MKQLKFMLAAAATFGIASAQAATEELDNETFTYPDTKVVTEINGFSFEGAAGDNESAIVNNALKVNTGTDPLLRQINTKYGEAIDLTAEGLNSIVIDTMVQFTVTPEGDTVLPSLLNPEAKDEDGNVILKDNIKGDKFLLYLKETKVSAEDGAESTVNKLRVLASKITKTSSGIGAAKTDYTPVDVEVSNYSVTPGTWYRLKVETSLNTSKCVVFKVMIMDPAKETQFTVLENSASLDPNDATVFPSLLNVSSTTLTHVGFAGEGMVDDFVVTKDYVASSVDFTLALGTGVSAVQWTINENDMTGADTFSATAGTTLNVAIKSVTYDAGYAGTQDWTAWTYSAAASGSIEITAEKFADVSEGGVVTPTADAVEAVNAGSFMVPEATDDNAAAVAAAKAELGKALTWATSAAKGGKSYAAAIEAITAMNFADTTETATEQAYLLNCAPTEDAIKEKKDAFVFSAVTFDENGAPVVTVDPEFAGDVNGRIEIRGATSLDAEDAFTAPKKDGDAFFKAFLVK